MIKKPWVNGEGRIMYVNIKDYMLLFKSGAGKVRSCLLISSVLKCFLADALPYGYLAVSKLQGCYGRHLHLTSGYFPDNSGTMILISDKVEYLLFRIT